MDYVTVRELREKSNEIWQRVRCAGRLGGFIAGTQALAPKTGADKLTDERIWAEVDAAQAGNRVHRAMCG